MPAKRRQHPQSERSATAVAAGAGDATPSMSQYLEIKAANPDSLLWYRMGDFYELFFEDAVRAAEALSIVLTKRGKHLGEDIPMCGVPVVRADEYLQRLIRQGFRVAVCEQLEDPAEARKRGSKAVVRRDVVRIVTPGTLTEDELLDSRSRNFLMALFVAPAKVHAKTAATSGGGSSRSSDSRDVAFAAIDISTGECEIGSVSLHDLAGELARLTPAELLVSESALADKELKLIIPADRLSVTPMPATAFDSEAGARGLKERLGVSDLTAFGAFSRPELAATSALLRYIDLTQIGRAPMLRPPRRLAEGGALMIDAATRRSLELVHTTSEDRSATLLSSVDRTVTGAGGRALQARLSSPSTNLVQINNWLDAVGFFVAEAVLRHDLRDKLRGSPDCARALPRLAFGRGGPRDLAAVRDCLVTAAACAERLSKEELGLPSSIASVVADLAEPQVKALAVRLTAMLVDEAPHLKRDGGFIREGASAELDAARKLRDDSRTVLAELESRYANDTGVRTLKIRHNNILGYFVEVTQLNAKSLTSGPMADVFRHRQTMANAVRFSSPELLEIEGRIASATERALNLELEFFDTLAGECLNADATLMRVADALADLDVYCGLAEAAVTADFVRPRVDDSLTFDIRGGRHPVVAEALARRQGQAFIENDCLLSADTARTGDTSRDSVAAQPGDLPRARLWLVTGPNMAGKSTFLRQNALMAVLAQAGSFVPARSAHIGIVDRLFSRVGAADDLARGRSTFMVEMVETAAILNAATERSFVILDEIGRGTATFDGLSIAWATVEYLDQVSRCRAMFATHYHELTALAERLGSVANVTMDVSEWQDDIVFLHRVRSGAADRSYGIQVAKLAGLPLPVVLRAGEVLEKLEASDHGPADRLDALDDLPLFTAARPKSAAAAYAQSSIPPHIAALEKALGSLAPDELTPKAALDVLYELKALAAGITKADR